MELQTWLSSSLFFFLLSSCCCTINGYANQKILPETEVVRRINSQPYRTWTAERSKVFANHTFSQIQAMMGTLVSDVAPNVKHTKDPVYKEKDLPESFDGRKKWGKCVHYIRNQKQCGSCWAFGATEALADRFCIQGQDIGQLSPQYLVDCDELCMGCNGGTLSMAWAYMEYGGVVSNDCQKYVSGDGKVRKCSAYCDDGSKAKVYYAKSMYEVVTYWDRFLGRAVEKMKSEIFENGPIEVGYTVYQDFMSYKSGVYEHTKGFVPVGGHAVKIVGWGVDGPKKKLHWIVANSWGADWGEDGYFRIRGGVNSCSIESNVYAGMPDLKDI